MQPLSKAVASADKAGKNKAAWASKETSLAAVVEATAALASVVLACLSGWEVGTLGMPQPGVKRAMALEHKVVAADSDVGGRKFDETASVKKLANGRQRGMGLEAGHDVDGASGCFMCRARCDGSNGTPHDKRQGLGTSVNDWWEILKEMGSAANVGHEASSASSTRAGGGARTHRGNV
jgi:hypothetical protein